MGQAESERYANSRPGGGYKSYKTWRRDMRSGSGRGRASGYSREF